MIFPLQTAIVGIGGFGSAHHGVFARLEERGAARVAATCDPALGRLGETCELHQFGRRGVKTYKDFDEMLAAFSGPLDLGVIASPIQFHAPMHKAFVRRQAACYLEKPPTLDPGELQEMLAVEKQAVVATTVGFSFIYVPGRLELKRRMLDGEFGRLKRLGFLGFVPRTPAYFQRNNWAGKLTLNGKLVLDSCLGNAMSHYLNTMLFFGDQEHLQGWARPAEMTCELYRANPIEGTDTIFAICTLENGVELRIAASHACPNEGGITEESLKFEHATVTIRSGNHLTIQRPGLPDEISVIEGASLENSVKYYLDFLRGIHSRPAQTLEDCRGFVETNALFYLAGTQIHDFPRNSLNLSQANSVISLPDIEQAARRLISERLLPSQAGYAWANPGGSSAIAALPKLEKVVRAMA